MAADSRALVMTCPSLSEMRLMGIRDSGSVAWPASSRKTWVKCPTLWEGGMEDVEERETMSYVRVCVCVFGSECM